MAVVSTKIRNNAGHIAAPIMEDVALSVRTDVWGGVRSGAVLLRLQFEIELTTYREITDAILNENS